MIYLSLFKEVKSTLLGKEFQTFKILWLKM